MVFSSAAFLFVFLPVTLGLYYFPVFRHNCELDIKRKNLVLCLSSLVFYAWGEPIYIVLMLISIFFNYNLGIDIELNREKPKKAKLIFIFGIVFNLFLLGFFKYSGFVAENISKLFSVEMSFKELPLPVGISFYTFQILSYIIDVYKGEVKVQKKLIPFASYITMFPQLIAGPIVQYSDVEAQLTGREITAPKFAEGVIIFIRGMGKKILFANTVGAVYTQIISEEIASLSVVTSWIGIICYTLQIYFDFSGYSDMAVGLGKMLGFEFVKNFNFPYKASSITDFWRRWHISLSTWFRDYVYIPLGGNRKGNMRTIFNILVVWSLTGLWHGAAWNFIAWGAFYGILLIAEKYLLKNILDKIPSFLKHIGTLIVVMIGWVFFSSETFAQAIEYISSMFCLNSNSFIDLDAKYLLSTNAFSVIVMSLSAAGVFDYTFSLRNTKKANIVRYTFYIIVFVLCVFYMISDTYNPFLYFRF